MRSLLRNHRGSVGFATAVALVPLIGFIALGAEAGGWYVTKQHAQNAADAAAYSSGLTLACALSEGTACDTADYVDRGEQFAAHNGFCNSGATLTGCPDSLVQTVTIARGTLAGGAWSDDAAGFYIRAVVTQQQQGFLASLFGVPTVDIGAQAIVQVQQKSDVCALGLGPASDGVTIGGNSSLTGNGCALQSNTGAQLNSEPTFSGSGWGINSVTGCDGGHCDISQPHNYSSLPAYNPLNALDGKSYNSRTGNDRPLANSNKITCPVGVPADTKNCYAVPPNSGGTSAYGNMTVTTGDYVIFNPDNLASATYFFYNASIRINGGTVIGTNVTFVLLGNSSIDISGGTVTLSAPTANSFDSALSGILIDDQAPTHSSNNVNINGGSGVSLGGTMYFPNVEVQWGGNTSNTNTSCTQVIANSITFTGGASYLSSQGCVAGTVPKTQVVALVQ